MISLIFYVTRYVKNKPVIKSNRDIHIIIDDGCDIFLDKSDDTLTNAQRDNLKAMGNHNSRRKFLFYMNKELVDKWYFDTNDKKLEIHCPKCGRNYIITKEEYESAYQKFLEE